MNLVQTVPTVIEYEATPAGEQSVYFDAPSPAMNSTSRFTEALPAAGQSDGDLPGAFGHDEHALLDRTNKAPAVGDAKEGSGLRRNGSHRRSQSSSAAITTDSGYASGGGGGDVIEKRSQSRGSDGEAGFAPIPILWADSPHRRQMSLADEDRDRGLSRSSSMPKASPFRRAASLRSFRAITPATTTGERDDRGSIKTTPSIGPGPGAGTLGVGVRRRRTSLVQGSFASGPGLVGPASAVVLDDAFHARSESADLELSERQRLKLGKAQIKEGKKVAKIIKAEGRAEQKAIDEAVRELSDLQKLQKGAVKEESKAYAAYSKALREFRKAELEFFAARAKYERAQADLQAQEDAREASRAHAKETTEMLQEKNHEVEWLRAQKAVDDMEREAKVRQLTGK